jgi:hypothetical protein
MYTLNSFDDHPKVVDYLSIELEFLNSTLKLSTMEAVAYFLDLVKVGLVAILISID